MYNICIEHDEIEENGSNEAHYINKRLCVHPSGENVSFKLVKMTYKPL